MATLPPDTSIVYFGNDWSAENRTSSHHIARRLGARVPLLYVEVPGLRAPKASGRDLRKLARKLARTAELPRRIGPTMWQMTMPQWPFRRMPGAGALNHRLGAMLVRRALRRLDLRRTVSWFTVPHAAPVAGTLGERMIVYYCTDRYAAFPDVDPASVQALNDDLARRAGLVFVSSPTLLEPMLEINPRTVHSPHGVDVELFARAGDPAFACAPELERLRHPVIGFYGLIEAWIDLDLIAHLARRRPHWTIVMVGRLAVDPEAVSALENVRLFPPVPYEELPRWARAFDVCVLPYRRNQQVLNANPLKLREYLATGKPVVSVSTPEVDKFSGPVRIASSYDAFLAAVEDALERDGETERAARRAAVAGASWDNRVEWIIETVARRLEEISGNR